MKTIEKIRPLRKAEQISQPELCKMTGINLQTLRNCEQGKISSISSTDLEKITNHPRFEKYALWLITDKITPVGGQINPQIETERIRMGLPDNAEGYLLANESLSVGEKIRRVNQ